MTEPIARGPSGRASSPATGSSTQVDTIIFGTGFRVTDLPIADRVRGRDGRTPRRGVAGQPAGVPRHHRRRLPQPVPPARPEHRPRPHLGRPDDRGADRATCSARCGTCARTGARRPSSRRAAGAARVRRRGRPPDGAARVWPTGGCSSWYLDVDRPQLHPVARLHLALPPAHAPLRRQRIRGVRCPVHPRPLHSVRRAPVSRSCSSTASATTGGPGSPCSTCSAEHHDVIAIDLPGFGRSPAPPRTGMPSAVAEAHRRRASPASGLDRPHVAGNSLGGAIALELAAAGLARSATALSPAGFATPAQLRRALASCCGHRTRRLHPDAGARQASTAPASAGRSPSAGWCRDPGVAHRRTCPSATPWPCAAARASARSPGTAARYAFTRPPDGIPVTVAWGTRDRILLPVQADRRPRAPPGRPPRRPRRLRPRPDERRPGRRRRHPGRRPTASRAAERREPDERPGASEVDQGAGADAVAHAVEGVVHLVQGDVVGDQGGQVQRARRGSVDSSTGRPRPGRCCRTCSRSASGRSRRPPAR